MDVQQLRIETEKDGLVHLKKFMICPVLHSFISDGTVDPSLFDERINSYSISRLEYVLRTFFSINEPKTRFDTWSSIASYAVTNITPSVTRETWGRYRAVLIKSINLGLERGLGPEELVRDWLMAIKAAKAPAKIELRKHRDRNEKATKLTQQELYTLRLYAKNEIENFAVDWLEVSLCAGIRPVEIQTAELHFLQEGVFLSCRNVIKNERTKERLANGTYSERRLIPLAPVSFHSVKLIEQTLAKLHNLIEASDGYKAVYSKCRVALRDLSEKALGYKISISVGRKQFAANLKSLEIDNEEIANQMGHTDPTRPRRSYGKKSNGFATRASDES
ncbi:TPA: hypothetical protein I7E95_002657 [Vibrio cholerae]|nr:hypothetical protein [Vibrio cholerae]